VTVATVTKAGPPLFSEDHVSRGREGQARAHEILGVAESVFLDLPAAGLSEVPHRDINDRCLELVESQRPDWVLLPFGWDLHSDHREVFQSAMVALRPQGAGCGVRRIACYETVSETHWAAPGVEPAFVPNWHVDITSTLQRKLAAAREMASELKPFPHERSLEALESLARTRGTAVSIEAAEAFVIIRELGCLGR
jgi:LmbE family N-acetylglucosaminyl deacetylase